ncbi:MAG: hypothetical protein IJO32_00405 [Bacilli bacterium]|nr:hypothetical protein [Bacilli bacterium]
MIMVNLKDYNLENFKEKDLYTVDEVISKIEDMECTIHTLQEKLKELNEQKERDMYEDYRLGLI